MSADDRVNSLHDDIVSLMQEEVVYDHDDEDTWMDWAEECAGYLAGSIGAMFAQVTRPSEDGHKPSVEAVEALINRMMNAGIEGHPDGGLCYSIFLDDEQDQWVDIELDQSGKIVGLSTRFAPQREDLL
jgi:hypothetical protein